MRRIGKREIESLRQRLLAAERTLLGEIEEHEGERRSVAASSETEEDRGQDASLERNLELLGEHERRELAEILGALGRIDQGTYGTCASCGEPITLARLRAVPATAHCRDCHAAAESARTRR